MLKVAAGYRAASSLCPVACLESFPIVGYPVIRMCRRRCASTRPFEAKEHSTPPSASASSPSSPWQYEDVDPLTNSTHLERLFSRSSERIRAILDAPLPQLPDDGTMQPDFFVGFAHYNFRLRDQYRALIAQRLCVPLREVKLSVGWSGRFDVGRFHGCRRVCGVAVASLRGKEAGGVEGKREEDSEGAASLGTRESPFAQFIHDVRGRKQESLLAMHMIDASMAVPEDATATAPPQSSSSPWQDRNRVESLAKHIASVARHHQVLFVLPVSKGPEATSSRRRRSSNDEFAVDDAAREVDDAAAGEAPAIVARWTKALVGRHIVPKVVRANCPELRAILEAPEGLQTRETAAEGQGRKEDKNKKRNTSATTTFCATDADCDAAVGAAVMRLGNGVGRLPAVFFHGSHVGSVQEMDALLRNRKALDALLLRPNDLGFHKAFLKRLAPELRRRDTLAADAVHEGVGRVLS